MMNGPVSGMVEARQMGFYLNPGPGPGARPRLDDDDAEVAQYLHDFTHYGAETRGAQRERRADDPHVPCEPPTQTFMTSDDVAWILREAGRIDEETDFYSTEKYILVLTLIDRLQRR